MSFIYLFKLFHFMSQRYRQSLSVASGIQHPCVSFTSFKVMRALHLRRELIRLSSKFFRLSRYTLTMFFGMKVKVCSRKKFSKKKWFKGIKRVTTLTTHP